MKKQLTLSLGAAALLLSGANAQGLLSIGQYGNDDFDSKLPFTTTIGVTGGWDSNPGNAPDGAEQDSAYIRGGISAAYGNGSRRTNVNFTGGFSTIYYFDQVEGQDEDTFYSAQAGVNVFHRASRRLTLGNNTYFTYEIEPDNAIGASAARRLGQYIYGYNSAWASYTWNRRFSTVSRYTISGIDYEDDTEGFAEDRLTHTFSQEMRYVLNRLTTLVGDVRYSFTDYDTGFRDYDSIYLLAGVDHTFSSDLRGSVRVGAENRDYDNGGDDWRPYVESSLRYKLAERSSLVWVNRIGYEDSELGSSVFDTRYSYRSALTYRTALSDRLGASAGATYVHNEFEGGARSDVSENLISLRVGLSYKLFTNIGLNAGYNFSLLESDNVLREYDRHRVTAGLTWTF